MKKLLLPLTLAVAALAVGACVSSGTQVQDSQLAQFRKGITTEADVERALGAPQATSTVSDGTRVIVYTGTHAQTKAATFIPIAGAFVGGATAKTSSVTFRFDAAGKLIDYSSTQSSSDVRLGQ